jgi:hypothetical protein
MSSAFGTYSSSCNNSFGRFGSTFRLWDTCTFFSKPKLRIVYEPDAQPNTYCPIKDFKGHPQGRGFVKRKYLRVGVENTGRGYAEKCMAKLRVLENNSDEKENPETEPKILQWSTEKNIKEDISARTGFSVLNVVFSEEKSKFAFVGTQMSLNGPDLPRKEDTFGIGNFVFELVITTLHGYTTSVKFRLNVTSEWRELSMQKIGES